MTIKSEKRYYDAAKKKYAAPLCVFDTDELKVTITDEKTGKQQDYSFYSIYIQQHVLYVMQHQPDRFQKLVDNGEIYRYLTDVEAKAKDAVDRQVERWKPQDRDYLMAEKNDDFLERVRIINALEAQARELVYKNMIYV